MGADAGGLGVLGNGWLITSILLTAAAAATLALLILPAQDRALATAQTPGSGPEPRSAGRLAMLTGVFNLLIGGLLALCRLDRADLVDQQSEDAMRPDPAPR